MDRKILQVDCTIGEQEFRDWTPEEIAEAESPENVAKEAAREAEKVAAAALRDAVKTIAQSTVGQQLSTLDNTQILSLVAILLWKSGVLTNDLTIKPLDEWVN